MSLPKPNLRNLHIGEIKKHIAIVVASTTLVTAAFKVFVVDARKKKYENFYKTYDGETHLQEMVDAGLLESALKE